MTNQVIQNYFGGKNGPGIAQQIINHIRPHQVYAEVFGGSGAVLQMKKPAEVNYFNDLDRKVWQAWKDAGSRIDIPNLYITSTCAIEMLRQWHFHSHNRYCFYLDPPYPLKSRRSDRKVYRHEMTDAQHYDLLDTVRHMPENADVLISTYENPIYAEALADWSCHTFQAQTRKGSATEYLYMNYTIEDGILHQFDLLGTDWIDRQRIRRKIDRKVKQLLSLPATERQAILHAMAQLV